MSLWLRPKHWRGSRNLVDVAETKTGNTFAPQSVNLTLCGPGYARMNVEEAQVCESLDRMSWHQHLVSGSGHEGPFCQRSVGNKLIVLLQVCCLISQLQLCLCQNISCSWTLIYGCIVGLKGVNVFILFRLWLQVIELEGKFHQAVKLKS